ncbi:MAG: N-acetylmuramoyl-L-alanine amidase [Candidatus Buchananbacteria bacterium]
MIKQKIKAINIDNDILQKPIDEANYFHEICQKDLIVLHFTAGYNWQGAWATFAAPGKMSTPYIVDLTGPKHIVKLYDEKFWSYHLGIKEDRQHLNDKRSIGIEIVNIGPVWNKDGRWVDYLGKEWPESEIVKGKNRGADGGVKFPDEQVIAVAQLVNYLCQKYKIKKVIPAERINCQWPGIGNFKGIATHQMFRKDKYDLGVAWPWEKFLKECGVK